MTKARDCINGKANHLEQGILGRPGETFVSLILHSLLAKTNPGGEAAHETMVLAHRDQSINDPPIQQAKIPCVAWYLNRGNACNQAIEEGGCEQFEACLTVATAALSIDDLCAIFPACDQCRNDLWRVLQIGIKDDHRLTPRIIQPSGDGDLMPKVA